MITKRKKIFEEIRILFILILIAFTVKSTLLEIYVVPTGSMEDTILTGDMLVGNKFIYGMRTPTWVGIPWTRLGFDIPWVRLPSFKKVENGDITIFEFPRDPFQKYVKRCVGIPGDSVYVELGKTYVNSNEMDFPKEGKYVKGHIYQPDVLESSLYPYLSGNRDNIEGFIVPYKGMKIHFKDVADWETIITLLVQDGNEVKIYDKTFIMTDPMEVARTHGFIANKLYRLFSNKRDALIREQKQRVKFINKFNMNYKSKGFVNPWHVNFNDNGSALILENLTINGKTVSESTEYTIEKNYYFLMGDNRDSSYDSRFWGFVPHDQILGAPLFAMLNIFKLKLRLKVLS